MLGRRTILQVLLSSAAWGAVARRSAAGPLFADAQLPRLMALADVVLPLELGADGRARAVNQFLAWLRDSSRRAAVLVSHSPLVDLGLAQAFGVPTTEWTIDGGRA